MEFLSRNNFEFEEKNISRELSARDELVARGFRATPVTLIDDTPIIGFSASHFRKALGI